jgi:hypothetical protein
MKTAVVWNVAQFSLVESFTWPEDGACKFHRRVDKIPPDYTASDVKLLHGDISWVYSYFIHRHVINVVSVNV